MPDFQRQRFLGEHLLEQWSCGFVSAKSVQEIAFAATQDGLSYELINQFAKIGNTGTNSKCDRDLRRLVAPTIEIPEPLMLQTRLLSYKAEPPQLVDSQVAIMPIYSLLRTLYDRFPLLMNSIGYKPVKSFKEFK